MRAIGVAIAQLPRSVPAGGAPVGEVLRLRVGPYRLVYTVEGDLITRLSNHVATAQNGSWAGEQGGWTNPKADLMMKGVAGRITEWVRPHVPEASDGILTSAGICEGFAGAGVSTKVLIFAGFAGLVAGTLAAGAVEYSKLGAERDQQVALLASERAQLETAPDAELDELTQLYVSRGLSHRLARQVAIELTAHGALAAHAEAEYGVTPASLTSPLREALAVGAAFAAGAVLPWLAVILTPGSPRPAVIFVIVLLALALTGWVSAQISDVHPLRPIVRTAAIGVLSITITYAAGHLFHP